MKKLLVLLAPLLAMACLPNPLGTGPANVDPSTPHAAHVLFIGNSLTAQNDLPGVFADLAIAGGYDVGVGTVAYPNTALIDYVSDRDVMGIIDRGGWDFVVLQQGTTSLPVCRDTLVLAAQIMSPRIRAAGGKPAIMMSWPSSDRQFAFPAVHDSYALAAQAVAGLFLPVGDAWLEAWKANPEQALYGGDGYHPGAQGTYLAALVIYEKLSGKDARDLPVNLTVGAYRIQLSSETVRALQKAAHDANARPVPTVIVAPTQPSTPITC